MMQLLRQRSGYLVIAALSLLAVSCMQPAAVIDKPIERTVSPSQTYSYSRDIKPVLERKCIACHGCYDAPLPVEADIRRGPAQGGNRETGL